MSTGKEMLLTQQGKESTRTQKYKGHNHHDRVSLMQPPYPHPQNLLRLELRVRVTIVSLSIVRHGDSVRELSIIVKKKIKVYVPSDGCSKPQSDRARSNSGFNKKSLKPEEWIPT